MSRRARLVAPLALALLLAGARSSRGDGLCVVHGYLEAADTRISGGVTVDRGDGPSTAVGLPYDFELSSSDMQGWTPIGRGDAVDVTFSLAPADAVASGRATIQLACRRASFAALATGRTLSLKTLCGAVASDAGVVTPDPAAPAASLRVLATIPGALAGAPARDVWLVFDLAALAAGVDATATATATLDANGEGPVTFALALPTTSITSSAIVDPDSFLTIADAAPVTIQLLASELRGSAVFAPRNDACPPSSGGCDCGGPAGGWRPGGG